MKERQTTCEINIHHVKFLKVDDLITSVESGYMNIRNISSNMFLVFHDVLQLFRVISFNFSTTT